VTDDDPKKPKKPVDEDFGKKTPAPLLPPTADGPLPTYKPPVKSDPAPTLPPPVRRPPTQPPPIPSQSLPPIVRTDAVPGVVSGELSTRPIAGTSDHTS